MTDPSFAILICTKNRLKELMLTLGKIQPLLENPSVECRIIDDGSTDGTYEYLMLHYAGLILSRNKKSQGLICCRNKMLNETRATYAISLDDDSHFLSVDPLSVLEMYFDRNPKCGVIGFRIFWGRFEPTTSFCSETALQVQSFVGCGHVWRMSAWHDIPDYPEWFEFYGEEDFASWNLLKKNWAIHYLPDVLLHHRVDLGKRREQADYTLRMRRSLRSGWYLILLFFPTLPSIRLFLYSLYMQIKKHIKTKNWRGMVVVAKAGVDLIANSKKIWRSRRPFSAEQYKLFKSLPKTRIFWNPDQQKTK